LETASDATFGSSSGRLATLTSPFPTREILGVKVAVCNRDEAVSFLLERLEQRRLTRVAFANLLTILGDEPDGARILDRFLVFNDGVGLEIASKLLYGVRFPSNLNGSDFTPALLAAAPRATRVFLLGAKPGVARKAATVITQRFGLRVCGTRDGYEGARDPASSIASIRTACPDIVLVALGNPRQERWIAENGARLGAPIIMGIGALFDFFVEAVPRAPFAVQRLRLEWLWRMALEPRRLGKRYTVDLVRFLWRVWQQRQSPVHRSSLYSQWLID
jgi:exopolysaccharide biosynthesis WecB/TagA/CpsF family protein